MTYSDKSIAIVGRNSKLAALLFDYVIPLYPDAKDASNAPPETLDEILPMQLRPRDDPPPFGSREFEFWMEAFAYAMRGASADVSKGQFDRDQEILGLHEHLKNGGIPSIPIFENPKVYSTLLAKSATEQAVEVKSMSAQIVNADNLDWAHVLEIRSDVESLRKLRNFRLFLHGEFEGKSPSYVRDALCKRNEEHEAACKKHGVDLISSTITSLLDSKTLICSSSLVTASILSEIPPVALIAGLGGIVIELGKMTITIATKMYDEKMRNEMSEIAYLVELKRKTASDSK